MIMLQSGLPIRMNVSLRMETLTFASRLVSGGCRAVILFIVLSIDDNCPSGWQWRMVALVFHGLEMEAPKDRSYGQVMPIRQVHDSCHDKLSLSQIFFANTRAQQNIRRAYHAR